MTTHPPAKGLRPSTPPTLSTPKLSLSTPTEGLSSSQPLPVLNTTFINPNVARKVFCRETETDIFPLTYPFPKKISHIYKNSLLNIIQIYTTKLQETNIVVIIIYKKNI